MRMPVVSTHVEIVSIQVGMVDDSVWRGHERAHHFSLRLIDVGLASGRDKASNQNPNVDPLRPLGLSHKERVMVSSNVGCWHRR